MGFPPNEQNKHKRFFKLLNKIGNDHAEQEQQIKKNN